jgi:hypothetical protein
MVFSYMGPKDRKPPFPLFDFRHVPSENMYVTKFQLECNWLQATEGDFDPSHGFFLHSTLDNNRGNPGRQFGNRPSALTGVPNRNLLDREVPADEPFPFAVGTRRVTMDYFRSPKNAMIEEVDGAMFRIHRNTLADGREVVSHELSFLMPAYCPPGTSRPNHFSNNIRIPIDNTHMMFFRLRWSLTPMTQDDIVYYKQGGYAYPEMIPGTFKTKANVWNDYEVDRLGQKTFLYSGIKTFPLQDIAMMENQWGPLADRTREHLCQMDYLMIYLRRKLLRAARAMRDGIEPEEPFKPEVWRYHAASAVIENGDVDAAIAKAREKSKATLIPAGFQSVAPQIPV